jgi:preprotein translocase subunit SecG
MTLFLIIFLSAFLVLDCIVLVFLVLMQLPKKEAGAGLAFGGAATDALFGAGSGNFLTKATKYTAGIFFALAIILSVLQSWRAHQPGSDFLERVKAHQNEQPSIVAPPATPPPAATQSTPPVLNTNNIIVAPSPDSLPTTQSNAAPVTTTPQK